MSHWPEQELKPTRSDRSIPPRSSQSATALWGGALADHLDRRKLLVRTGAGQVVLTLMLVVNASVRNPQVWVLFAAAPLAVVLSSLQRPSREALIPRVVERGQLAAAVSLSSLGMQVGQLLGPTIGGVLAVTAGVRWAFAVDLVGLAVATWLFSRLDPHPPDAGGERASVASIVAGLRYALGRKDLLGTYVIDITLSGYKTVHRVVNVDKGGKVAMDETLERE